MKKIILISCLIALAYGQSQAQTTYNLDVIWHCPKPDTFPWGMWGYSVAAGDFNNDGFVEIVTYTTKGNVSQARSWKKYYYESNPLDTISEIIINDSLRSASPPAMCSGDFNGDGITDLAITDPIGWDTLGRVDIYYGNSLFDMMPDTAIHGPPSAWGSEFGRAIASGDVNGDGIDDLVVGAYWGNSVYIYYGDTLGIHTTADVILHNKSPSECFGISVGSGGDMNGDGCDELVVGADWNSEVYSTGGKVYIYAGGNPMDTMPDAWMFGENIGAQLGGFDVSIVPNKNNAYATGWWGTELTPKWPPSTGRQYWVYGNNPINGDPDLAVSGYYYDSGLGQTSAFAGDVDSNKMGDFISGTITEGNYRGAAYLWINKNNMIGACDASILGLDSSEISGGWMMLGSYVTTVGDVNKDGKDEIAVSNFAGDALHAIWICKYTGPSGVAGEPEFKIQNSKFKIYQNTPNPFSQSTIIKYQLAQAGKVSLKLYNIQGQLVKVLVNEDKKMGSHEVQWNGRDNNGQMVSNGVYIYKLNTGGKSMAKRMTFIK